MRSKLLYSAEDRVHHEFLLASLAIRAMHRLPQAASGRTEDRVNQVLVAIAAGSSSEEPVTSSPPAPDIAP
jgi:hypothetical protein